MTIEAASVTTRMPPRDIHLRTGDFLEVKQHPRIRITADRVEPAGDEYKVHVTLEIKGEERPVELVAHRHQAGDNEVTLHLQGEIKREDFGIKPKPPAAWMVGQTVNLDAELVLVPGG